MISTARSAVAGDHTRPADTLFRRDAENHTRDGHAPRNAVVCTFIFHAFALSVCLVLGGGVGVDRRVGWA